MIAGGGLSDGEAVGVAFGVIIGVLLISLGAFIAYRERYRFLSWWSKTDEERAPVVFDNPTYAESSVQFQMSEKDFMPPGPEDTDA